MYWYLGKVVIDGKELRRYHFYKLLQDDHNKFLEVVIQPVDVVDEQTFLEYYHKHNNLFK